VRATKVNAGLTESNGKLLLGIWRDSLHVTCGLTACTPGLAPDPTLGNFTFLIYLTVFLQLEQYIGVLSESIFHRWNYFKAESSTIVRQQLFPII